MAAAAAQDASELVLRGFNFCVIDEVDSILVDEARTPLIISGAPPPPPPPILSAWLVADCASETHNQPTSSYNDDQQ